jgi:photosystem II stability/assembly factor-like uncharacterized protein
LKEQKKSVSDLQYFHFAYLFIFFVDCLHLFSLNPILTLMKTRFFLLVLGCILAAFPAFAQKLDMSKFESMKARNIGPAGMSGRVTTVDVVQSNTDIVYIGSASGGAWKSTNGGLSFKPIFDDQPVSAIGALAVNQQNPDIIWIGTGEGNPRNSENAGNGVYKSIDGGQTWTHLGLDATRNIHRIVLDPRNANVAYIGAIGASWAESEDRGVYKTTDGGKTWAKILYTNNLSGVADMVVDPSNPNKIMVAMWEHRRWPWFMKSGGTGSGLYLTYDGGATWKKLNNKENSIPDGDLGRCGLAISHSSPNVMYALIEAKKNGLYRSDDGGKTWRNVNDTNIARRPFYFSEIYVDPQNENRLYNLQVNVEMSEDAGKSWRAIASDVHSDHHAFWINPENPKHIIEGNDGGIAISRDMAKSWQFIQTLPLGQFYHVNVDNAMPYRVYGGMQDNGSWRGPGYLWQGGGILNTEWEDLGGGDGFDVAPDPFDDRYVYSMSQGGALGRGNFATSERKNIRPIHPEGKQLRFNWNAALATDPRTAGTIYYGSQYLHKSTNRGDSWEIISPDLTTNNPEKQKQYESGGLSLDITAAENHTTILAIAPSPVQSGVIWVGTDDGNLQLTTDGGKTWTNVIKNVMGVPENTWIPQIQASTYNAAEAFVIFDNHRRNDWTPYVFYTKDYGKTWTKLVEPSAFLGFTYCVIQDPIAPNLLFVGAETGLYVSIDFGKTWTKWTQGMPTVPVMDLVIQSREHDLVMATFGRSFYILDDIRPLRTLAKEGVGLMDKSLTLFDIPDAIMANSKAVNGYNFLADEIFQGQNRGSNPRINLWLKPDEKAKAEVTVTTPQPTTPPVVTGQGGGGGRRGGDGSRGGAGTGIRATMDVLNSKGEVIRTVQFRDLKAGLNRVSWDMRQKGVRNPMQAKPTEADAPEPGGISIIPNQTYTIRLKYGETVVEKPIKVLADPRTNYTQADYEAMQALRLRAQRITATTTDALDRVRDAQKVIQTVETVLKDRTDDAAKDAKTKGTALNNDLKAVMEQFTGRTDAQGYISPAPTLIGPRLSVAQSYTNTTASNMGTSAEIALKNAEVALNELITMVNGIFGEKWTAYKAAVDASKIEFFKAYEPVKY